MIGPESEYERASERDSEVGSILIPSTRVYMGLYMYEIQRARGYLGFKRMAGREMESVAVLFVNG